MKKLIKIIIGAVLGIAIVFTIVFAVTPENATERKTLSNLKYHNEQVIEIINSHAQKIITEPEKWDWDTYAWAFGVHYRYANNEEIGYEDFEQVREMLNAKIQTEEYDDIWGEVEEATNRDNPNE